MVDTLRPIASCRPHDRAALLRDVATRCDRLVDEIIAATGWTLIQIAVRLGCSERALTNWRTGDAEPGTARFEAIKLLRDEVVHDRKRTG